MFDISVPGHVHYDIRLDAVPRLANHSDPKVTNWRTRVSVMLLVATQLLAVHDQCQVVSRHLATLNVIVFRYRAVSLLKHLN